MNRSANHSARTRGVSKKLLVLLNSHPAHGRIVKLGLADVSGAYEVAHSVAELLLQLISIPTVSVLAIAHGVGHDALVELTNALCSEAWQGRRLQLIVGHDSPSSESSSSFLRQLPPNIETFYFETRTFFDAVKNAVARSVLGQELAHPREDSFVGVEAEATLRREVLAVRRQLEQIGAQLEELAGAVSMTPGQHQLGRLGLPKERQLVLLELMRQLDAVRLSRLESYLECQPVWSMLAELYKSQLLQREISVTDVCLASGVPVTTALRKLEGLIAGGWVIRTSNTRDRRRVNAALSDLGFELVLKILLAFNEAFQAV